MPAPIDSGRYLTEVGEPACLNVMLATLVMSSNVTGEAAGGAATFGGVTSPAAEERARPRWCGCCGRGGAWEDTIPIHGSKGLWGWLVEDGGGNILFML